MTITIHTDGGSRGNPGKAATGFIIDLPGQERISHGEYIGETTNNVAEYTAILQALQHTVTACKATQINPEDCKVQLFLDSELAQKQLTHVYKIKNPGLKTLCQQIWNAEKPFDSVTYTHVKRHLNKDADAMVNRALDALS